MYFIKSNTVCLFLTSVSFASQQQNNFFTNMTSPFVAIANMYTAGCGGIFEQDKRKENSFLDSINSNPSLSIGSLYLYKKYFFKNIKIPKIDNLKILTVSFLFLAANSLYHPENFEKEKISYSFKNLLLTPLKIANNSFSGDAYKIVNETLNTFDKNHPIYNSQEEKNFFNGAATGLYTLVPSLYWGIHKCYITRLGIGISAVAPLFSLLYKNKTADEVL